MRWEGSCSTYGGEERIYRFLVGKPEGMRPFGRTGDRWTDNIKMDLQEVGWEGHGLGLVQDRDRWRGVVNAVKNLRVP